MGTAVLFTSGKGGAGKSTLAVNCGAALALSGRKVLLIDADAGLRALDLMLSVSGKVVFDLSDILSGRCEPEKAVVSTGVGGLDLIPAPAGSPFITEGFDKLCGGLCREYDYVLIDSPAGAGESLRVCASGAGSAIVVATADPVCIRDADHVASILISGGVRNIRLVINRVSPKLILKRNACNLDRVIDAAGIQLIGIVPEDEEITLSVYSGKPAVLGRTKAAQALRNIAGRIDGKDIPLMKF